MARGKQLKGSKIIVHTYIDDETKTFLTTWADHPALSEHELCVKTKSS